MRIPGDPAIAVDTAGDMAGGAPLLVFLHGIGGNRSNWSDQLMYFGSRFRAVAWDARGYGDSDDGGELRFEDFADDLARVIGHFGGPAHVVGLSMGGRIALDAWARYPDFVASLTLADCSAGSAATAAPDKIEAFLAVRRKPLVEGGKTPADIAPEIARAVAGPNITAAALTRLVESHAQLRAGPYLATMAVVTRFVAFPLLETVAAPVLVMVGSEDHIATPAYAAEMTAALPNARLVVLPGAGHISNIEAPEAFNAALDAFLTAQ